MQAVMIQVQDQVFSETAGMQYSLVKIVVFLLFLNHCSFRVSITPCCPKLRVHRFLMLVDFRLLLIILSAQPTLVPPVWQARGAAQ